MLINQFILKNMRDHIGKHIVNYNGEAIPQRISFIDETTDPQPDYLCIATRDSLGRFVNNPKALDGAYIFVANGPDAEKLPLFENCSYFETDLDPIPLYNLLNTTLDRLGSSTHARSTTKADFADFFHDVAAMHITREDEIATRLRAFPNVNDNPYRVMVFEFDDPQTSVAIQNNFASSLQKVFVHSNAAIYFNRVVAIAQATTDDDDKVLMPERRESALASLCEKYRCCGSVSNTTRNWAVMRIEYLVANSTLSIAKKMRDRPSKRLFFAEEYAMYQIIDSYYHEFERIYHTNSYIYMLHPGIGALIRYDNEHKTDLRKLAYYYLLNERNITKTAAQMTMHRNTVIYKVKKITELIEDDLEDPMIRQRILFSCMMCDYFERALGIAPNTFPGYIG